MKVLLTGANGMLGTNIRKAWESQKDPEHELVTLSREDVDLESADETRAFLASLSPDLVIHTAAKVGGIAANIADPTSFLMTNLLIDSSVLKGSVDSGISRLIYLGSSCMYPKDYRQPLIESDVLAGPLEPTNEGYALSKIAAAKYCQYASSQLGLNYKVVIPSNLYGPGDHYGSSSAHLVAAALAKVHAAKKAGTRQIEVWGDGNARREFTFVGDLAEWLVNEFPRVDSWAPMMNVGSGADQSVREYYEMAMSVVGYSGELVTDPSKPSGMRRKLMDSSLAMQHNWNPSTPLEEGMRIAYAEFTSSGQ